MPASIRSSSPFPSDSSDSDGIEFEARSPALSAVSDSEISPPPSAWPSAVLDIEGMPDAESSVPASANSQDFAHGSVSGTRTSRIQFLLDDLRRRGDGQVEGPVGREMWYDPSDMEADIQDGTRFGDESTRPAAYDTAASSCQHLHNIARWRALNKARYGETGDEITHLALLELSRLPEPRDTGPRIFQASHSVHSYAQTAGGQSQTQQPVGDVGGEGLSSDLTTFRADISIDPTMCLPFGSSRDNPTYWIADDPFQLAIYRALSDRMHEEGEPSKLGPSGTAASVGAGPKRTILRPDEVYGEVKRATYDAAKEYSKAAFSIIESQGRQRGDRGGLLRYDSDSSDEDDQAERGLLDLSPGEVYTSPMFTRYVDLDGNLMGKRPLATPDGSGMVKYDTSHLPGREGYTKLNIDFVNPNSYFCAL